MIILKNKNMSKEKWICQSFWTRPMGRLIKNNVNIAKISLYYAHNSGYLVRMHTDSIGYEYLKDFGYDEIVVDLNEIPADISESFFAYSKYIALKNEPVGVVHTDFDVFIKKPCMDMFYNEKTFDVILQNRETTRQYNVDKGYCDGRAFFSTIEKPLDFHPEHRRASNVGVIGFNNQEAKDAYLNLYKECVDFYKYKTHKFNFIPDLFFEQVNIDYLVNNAGYKVFYILPELDYNDLQLHKCANNVGFQHLLGSWKNSREGIKFIENFSKKISGQNTEHTSSEVSQACL